MDFDWASMINIPNKVVMNDDDDSWLNNLLSKPISIPLDLSSLQSSASHSLANSNSNSAVNLSSMNPFQFDNESIFSESLTSSSDNSLNNSPIIKPEEPCLSLALSNFDLPELDLCNSEITVESNQSQNSQIDSTVESKKTAERPKKKRAPRKRLTPHQKQAHNKIEKKYRININTKIANLQSIIPWVSSEKTAFETSTESINKDGDEEESPRLNKSMILEKATAYILYLKENEIKYKQENENLKNEVIRLGGNVNV